jgi:lysophospholipid acyltransferase (LPLAT)-like uncharacterized protein
LKKKIKYYLYRYFFPYLGLIIVKMIAFTNRLQILDPQNEREIIDKGKSLIYISWHQRFFPGITFFAKRKPISIMISQSRDGEFIAHVVKVLGWEPVRGSSSRGGKEALERLNELALKGYKIGHIIDGPKGPFGVVKPGLLRIAQATGLPIVPTITSAQKKWVLGSWDKFMIPKLFSRVIIRFGKPIHVPTDLNKDAFEQKRLEIERCLEELYEDTDRIWGNPTKIRKIFPSRIKMLNFTEALRR